MRALGHVVLFALLCSATRARAEVPTPSERHVRTADAHARAGSDVLAESHYREAIHADPRNVAAYVGLARVLAHVGRHEEALELARVGLRAAPASLELAAIAADEALAAGDVDGALEPLARVCEARPTAECARRLADVAERAGAHPMALAALRRARGLGATGAALETRIALLERLLGPMITSGTEASASRPGSRDRPGGSPAPSPGCTDTRSTGAR